MFGSGLGVRRVLGIIRFRVCVGGGLRCSAAFCISKTVPLNCKLVNPHCVSTQVLTPRLRLAGGSLKRDSDLLRACVLVLVLVLQCMKYRVNNSLPAQQTVKADATQISIKAAADVYNGVCLRGWWWRKARAQFHIITLKSPSSPPRIAFVLLSLFCHSQLWMCKIRQRETWHWKEGVSSTSLIILLLLKVKKKKKVWKYNWTAKYTLSVTACLQRGGAESIALSSFMGNKLFHCVRVCRSEEINININKKVVKFMLTFLWSQIN